MLNCPTLFHESQSNNMSNLAGLLAHPIATRPSHPHEVDSDTKWLRDNLVGYTAAGLLRSLTWFPFNPQHTLNRHLRHQIFGCKITKNFLYAMNIHEKSKNHMALAAWLQRCNGDGDAIVCIKFLMKEKCDIYVMWVEFSNFEDIKKARVSSPSTIGITKLSIHNLKT